jgi:hypothetical protein
MTLFNPMVWPLATLVIALIFRRDVSQALGRVGQVKYRDLELTFREDLHKAEQLAGSIPTPAAKGPVLLEVARDEAEPLIGRLISPPSTPDGPLRRRESLEGMAVSRPREAIEAAWGLVSRASKPKLRRMAAASPDLASLVSRLKALRDRAARPDQPPPSPEDARRFVDLARRVATKVEEHG